MYNNTVSIKKHNKTLLVKKYNKTVSIKENISLSSCKPIVASSILFLLVSVIITGAFVYFCVNSQSKRKFGSTEKNKFMLRIYTELWDEIKEQIELITDDKLTKYR